MCDIDDKSQSLASADYFRTIRSEPVMCNDASLEIADIVGRLVHQLNVPDAALMRLLEPFEFALKEV